jgi:hypothetical protein
MASQTCRLSGENIVKIITSVPGRGFSSLPVFVRTRVFRMQLQTVPDDPFRQCAPGVDSIHCGQNVFVYLLILQLWTNFAKTRDKKSSNSCGHIYWIE